MRGYPIWDKRMDNDDNNGNRTGVKAILPCTFYSACCKLMILAMSWRYPYANNSFQLPLQRAVDTWIATVLAFL